MHHFQNQLYNAEIRDGIGYCCCDVLYTVVPCVKDLTDLDGTACTFECEPYLEIRFELCFADGTCSIVEDETVVSDIILATCITPLLVQLQLNKFVVDNIFILSTEKASVYSHRDNKFVYYLFTFRQHYMWMYEI